MSCQKGNLTRTRPQKHKNNSAFKNNLYDQTPKTKFINSLNIANVCERCKSILEWKIKYKKYKPLKAPKTCTKCDQKSIKHAYHTLCRDCAIKAQVCPKCGKGKEIVKSVLPPADQIKLDSEIQKMVKGLPERKRRTFYRFLAAKEKEGDGAEEGKANEANSKGSSIKEELVAKLEALKLQCGRDDDSCDDDDFSGDDDLPSSGDEENSEED